MKKKYKILIGITALLIVIRIILPYVVLHYANKTLATMPGYYGHIEDIDLALIRGAYMIDDFYLNKLDSVTNEQTPFLKSKKIDLSVEWKSLFHGSIVGELEFNQPQVIFTKDKAELDDVQKDTSDFRVLLKKFMPLKINRFEMHEGEIHYTDLTAKPKIDVFLHHMHILAQNLSNVVDENVTLPSTVNAQASLYEGTLSFNMKLNALAENPTFDVNTEVKNVNMVLLNDFFKAYGKFDVNKGNFGLYTEMATKDRKFSGYVKPIIKDLDVVGPEDRNDGFFHKMYETLVGAVGVVFKNPNKKQLATKVTLEGNIDKPDADVLDAVWQVIRNAFIQALVPSIENQINLSTVGKEEPKKDNIIKKLFGPSDKDKSKKK